MQGVNKLRIIWKVAEWHQMGIWGNPLILNLNRSKMHFMKYAWGMGHHKLSRCNMFLSFLSSSVLWSQYSFYSIQHVYTRVHESTRLIMQKEFLFFPSKFDFKAYFSRITNPYPIYTRVALRMFKLSSVANYWAVLRTKIKHINLNTTALSSATTLIYILIEEQLE